MIPGCPPAPLIRPNGSALVRFHNARPVNCVPYGCGTDLAGGFIVSVPPKRFIAAGSHVHFISCKER